MRYFIIAGEASGDMHAAALLQAIKEQDDNAVFCGMGGDKMQEAGSKLVQDYRQMSFMGVVAVVRNWRKVAANFHIAKQSIKEFQPDILILVDYPSFNLKIAQFVKKNLKSTKIVYYIPPKVWAWKKWRIHRVAKLADEILAILPFEPAFYEKYGYKIHYVGNPTQERIAAHRFTPVPPHQKPVIAILPGSRKSEISHCLPRMLQAARRISGYEIIVAAAPGIDKSLYQKYLADETLLSDRTYDLLHEAEVAVVNSGTATLETALIGCPQVAVYHIAFGTKFMVRLLKPLLFSIPYFTLVNIIAGKEVIRELLAYEFTADNVHAELRRLLSNAEERKNMLQDYVLVKEKLGTCSASKEAAKRVVALQAHS